MLCATVCGDEACSLQVNLFVRKMHVVKNLERGD